MTISESVVWSVLEPSPDGYVLTDRSGNILEVNAEGRRVLGLAPGLLSGPTVFDFSVGLSGKEALQQWERLVSESSFHFRTRCRTSLGERSLVVTGWPAGQGLIAARVQWDDEKKNGVDAQVHTLTSELTETRQRSLALVENLDAGFVLYEPVFEGKQVADFRYVEFNPAAARILGDTDAYLGRTILESDPRDGPVRVKHLAQVLATGKGADAELESQVFGLVFAAHSFQPRHGLVATLFTDVTHRRDTDRRLRDSERQLRIIFDSTGTSNSIFDTNFRLVRQNSESVAQLGIPEDQARGMHVRELFGQDRGVQIETRMRRVLETGASETFETKFPLVTGTKTFRSKYQPLFDGEVIVGLQIVSQDISEQVAAQEALRESELQFRTLFELAADLVCIAGNDNVFRAINPAGIALLKYDEATLLSRPYTDFVVPEDLEKTTRVVTDLLNQGKTVIQFENRYRCGDGSIVCLEWVSRPDVARGLSYAVARDVTARRRFEAEQKALEAHMGRSQKLESLGILAGGIAHDFNNILAGILGFVELATLRTSDEEQKRYLGRMHGGCLRAQALTRQLLTFARGGVPVLRAVPPGPLIEGAVQFASHGSTAKTITALGSGLPAVDCDPEQISQVVSNLVINALQAMDGQGTLTVAVNTDLEGIVCRFSDTGPGIPPDLVDKIFDPFFTTKKTGTGLGLSICHSVIQNHGGTLQVESTVGHGATFTFRLPRSTDQVVVAAAVNLTHVGAGRAVVVDDEEAVRTSVTALLGEFGYDAVAVSNAEELWAAFSGDQTPPVVCLLDLTIPGEQGGASWAGQLRSHGFKGAMIAMSGYSHDPVLAYPRDYGFDAALAKPFAAGALAETLEHLAEGRS